MLSEIKGILGTITSWRDNRESTYNLAASVAAALVVTAYATGARPSDALATVARYVQIAPVAEWLTVLPVANHPAPAVNGIMLNAVLTLLAWMVVFPLVRSWHEDNWTFFHARLWHVGAPSAATVWLLLLVAAQYGDIASPLLAWRDTAFVVALGVAIVLATAGALGLLAQQCGLDNLARFVLWPPVVVVRRVALGVGLAVFAIVVAPICIPAGIIWWFAGLESDRGRKDSLRH